VQHIPNFETNLESCAKKESMSESGKFYRFVEINNNL
jgi:hypothetical protein